MYRPAKRTTDVFDARTDQVAGNNKAGNNRRTSQHFVQRVELGEFSVDGSGIEVTFTATDVGSQPSCIGVDQLAVRRVRTPR